MRLAGEQLRRLHISFQWDIIQTDRRLQGMIKLADRYEGRLQALFDSVDEKVHMPFQRRSELPAHWTFWRKREGPELDFRPAPRAIPDKPG